MKRVFLAFFACFTVLAGFCQFVPAVIVPGTLFSADTSGFPLHGFSVTERDNKAVLRWRADSLSNETFYAVERSSNGVDFFPVGLSKYANGGWFEFTDDAPPRGKLHYRVKMTNGSRSFYSTALEATPVSDISLRFYPNPVDKVLIVKTEMGVDVQISDNYGKALIAERIPAGIKVMDVSSLEPGIYVITLIQKDSNRIISEKLIKK